MNETDHLHPPGATGPGTPASPQDEPAKSGHESMPSLETVLKQTELKAQEHYDAWLRAKAETENLRKRTQLDVAAAHKYAIENLAERLLPVRDSLEAALATQSATVA